MNKKINQYEVLLNKKKKLDRKIEKTKFFIDRLSMIKERDELIFQIERLRKDLKID